MLVKVLHRVRSERQLTKRGQYKFILSHKYGMVIFKSDR